MPSKKITGQSKLAQAAKKDKPEESLDLVQPRKEPTQKVFRLYQDDIARLKTVAATMNKNSHRHISETAAIRALLVIGANTSGEKLIKALRKTI